MCKCTPSFPKPFCGRPGCEPTPQCREHLSTPHPLCPVCNPTKTVPELNTPLPELPVTRMYRALRAAKAVLETDIDACANCNYGDGATGKGSEGEPCEDCEDAREALRLVREALT